MREIRFVTIVATFFRSIVKSAALLIGLHTGFWLCVYPLLAYGCAVEDVFQEGVGLWLMTSPALLLAWLTTSLFLFIGNISGVLERMEQISIGIFCLGILAINEVLLFSLTEYPYSTITFWGIYMVKILLWSVMFVIWQHFRNVWRI